MAFGGSVEVQSQWAGLAARRDESTDEDKADTGTHSS